MLLARSSKRPKAEDIKIATSSLLIARVNIQEENVRAWFWGAFNRREEKKTRIAISKRMHHMQVGLPAVLFLNIATPREKLLDGF